MSLVNSFNEWDTVEELIVGSSLYSQFPIDDYGFKMVERLDDKILTSLKAHNLNMKKIIEETEEDIANFISAISKTGITIKRPTPIKAQYQIQTPDWSSPHYFCYCPRDTLLAIGNTIIESPNGYRSRYLENHSYKDIMVEYIKSGSNWISAPKPRLLKGCYNNNDHTLSVDESEPIFDAANILRCGKDVFYLVSDSGNELGYQWLKNVLADNYRVHPCRNLYSGTHFDTTIAFLRPGLLLANPQRVSKDSLPAALKKWKILYSPLMETNSYSELPNLSSEWIGMNLLMLSPSLAVVDQNQTELIKLLEKYDIDVIPSLLRHSRVLSGGFHCITLDVRRKGALEDYCQ